MLWISISSASERTRITLNLNPAWHFQPGVLEPERISSDYDDSAWDLVALPHSHKLFPADLAGYTGNEREVGWYRRELQIPATWLDRKCFLEFQGAMQATTLWVNGKKVGTYAVSGYDSFHFDIAPFLVEGRNVLAVMVDNRPTRDIPPDGQLTDYILFGGLYRDVFLHVTDPLHLTFPWEARSAGVRLTLPNISRVCSRICG